MRNVRTQYPKSLRYEIVRVYLTGNNSYEELANIYKKKTDEAERLAREIRILDAVHEQTGEQKKMWKKKIYQKNDQSLQINP